MSSKYALKKKKKKVIVFAGLTDDNLWDFLCGCRRYKILVQPFESTDRHNKE